MRLILLSFFMFLVLGLGRSSAAETVFFESLYDIPVMLGLIEVTEQGISFDKVEGRIATATAVGDNVGQNGVLAFYTSVLPQMGWKELRPSIFVREAEKLEISFGKIRDQTQSQPRDWLLVRFSLGPVSE